MCKSTTVKALAFFIILFMVQDFCFTADCVSKCTVSDSSLTSCWPQPLEYFGENLIQAVNVYTSVLLHIQRWKVRHPEDVTKYETFQEDAIDMVISKYKEDEELYKNGPLKEDFIRTLFSVILNQTNFMIVEKYEDETELLPHFSCPVPCDYYPAIWIGLFCVMFVTFVLACLSFVVCYCMHMRKSRYTQIDQRSVGS